MAASASDDSWDRSNSLLPLARAAAASVGPARRRPGSAPSAAGRAQQAWGQQRDTAAQAMEQQTPRAVGNWDELEHPADSGPVDHLSRSGGPGGPDGHQGDQLDDHCDDQLDDHLGQWGLFGPTTVTWRVHSDPLVGLAMLRSLALQVLHPEGMANVFATARRVDDPWDRLTWAQRHIGAVIFGNSIEAAMTGARMRAVMAQVAGWSGSGAEYRGDDEELVLWMHCCQVASFVEVTRRGGLDLSDAEHETYLQEQVRTAAVWGLEPDRVPASRRDLTRYFRRVRPSLRMTHEARAFIGALLSPVPDLIAMTQRNRPAWAPVAGLAWTSLPSWARSMHSSVPAEGAGALTQAATTVALHSLRDNLHRAQH